MSITFELPEKGQIVRVRQRSYLVEEVTQTDDFADSPLVTLACVDDDAQGQSLQVLWDKELDREVLEGESWQHLSDKGFDAPELFSAYLHTMRWNSITASDATLFQSPFRAGIQLHAYQLEPLRKALRLPRVNLFIADDVGLGKTIEAGLIAQELLLRKRIRDIVIVCPPSVLLQWQEEMDTRFGLTFEILDKAYMTRIRQERGFRINPWTTHSRFLVSQRLLINEVYAAPLRDWLGNFHPGSLMIFDEAHNAAPSSGARYAIDSKLTRAIRDIAPRFEHRLFLSATPHNGHSNSFSALLEILDPQRFCRGVPVREKTDLGEVMVRRLKEDLREVEGGFPKRTVRQITLDASPEDTPELQLSRLLEEYRQCRAERLSNEKKRVQAASGLLITNLQQRLLSSAEAFARTLRVHRKTVQRQWQEFQNVIAPPPTTLNLNAINLTVDSNDDRATLSDDELFNEEAYILEKLSTESTVIVETESARTLFQREQQLLNEMETIAEAARYQPDARILTLLDWIRTRMCPGRQWNDMRLLIFTEYNDTRRYLVDQLISGLADTGTMEGRIEVFHGPTPPEKREEIKRIFNAPPSKHPLRILIATDAAREGINLQAQCYNLFHFDVPWNPGRLEQRNGRIDRKLQPEPEVFCHYFFYKHRPEDRILQVLVNKTDTIKRELGCLSPVLEARLTKALRDGISHKEVERLQAEIEDTQLEKEAAEAIDEELEAARDRQDTLRAQVDSLRNQLNNSRRAIGLDERHLRSALSLALKMQGAGPLQKISTESDMGSEAWAFPTLQGGSWAETLDSLRMPRKKDQKIWEWQKNEPIRPIVFQAPDTVTDEVVQLHLQHRIVQRLLSRFSAQGLIHHDLSRACLAQSDDSIPRVILLGRLSLYGRGAARLYEEIIYVTARWTHPSRRQADLSPYAADTARYTMELLEKTLLNPDRLPTETIQEQLLTSASKDIRELLPHLKHRGEEEAHKQEKALEERGQREADQMKKILISQRDRIEKAQKLKMNVQLELDFSQEERKQFEADQRHWVKRLQEIEEELSTEPDRIRAFYEVQKPRIEPVGLVYLWPVTG